MYFKAFSDPLLARTYRDKKFANIGETKFS